MSGGSLRERRRAETHDVILDTALDLMESKGYEQTTVEDIAAAVGISSRTFFRYFESKTALLLDHPEADRPDHDEINRAIAARPKDESPVEALCAVVREQLAGLFDDTGGRKLRQLRIVLSEPSLRVLARDSFHEHSPDLVRAFAVRLGVAEDSLRPRVLAAAFTEAIWVILEQWSANGASLESLPKLVDEAFDELTRSLG
jgi:AcrR family transcriptional regulator